jgi:hypothetical protein
MNIKVDHNNGIIAETLTIHIGTSAQGGQPTFATLVGDAVEEGRRILRLGEVEDVVLPFADELNAYRCTDEWKAKRDSFKGWFYKEYPQPTPPDFVHCRERLYNMASRCAQLFKRWSGRLDTQEFATELARQVDDGRLEKHELFDFVLELEMLDSLSADLASEATPQAAEPPVTVQFLNEHLLSESSFLTKLPRILEYFGYPDKKNFRQVDLIALYWLLARRKYITATGSRVFFNYLNSKHGTELISGGNLRQYKSRNQEMPPATYFLPEGFSAKKKFALEHAAYDVAAILGLPDR